MDRCGRAFYSVDGYNPTPGSCQDSDQCPSNYRNGRQYSNLDRGPGDPSANIANNHAFPHLPKPPPPRTKEQIKGRYRPPVAIKPAVRNYHDLTYVEKYNQERNPGFHLPGIQPGEQRVPQPPKVDRLDQRVRPTRHIAVYRPKVKPQLINLDLIDNTRPRPSNSERKLPTMPIRAPSPPLSNPPSPKQLSPVDVIDKASNGTYAPSPPTSPMQVFGVAREIVMSPSQIFKQLEEEPQDETPKVKVTEQGPNVGPGAKVPPLRREKKKKRKITRP